MKQIITTFLIGIALNSGYAQKIELVKDINPTGDGDIYNFAEYNGKVYFSANDGVNGQELWVTDGTTAGTQMLKDIHPSGDSNPSNCTNYNGELYFSAYNASNGTQLWKTDGTAAGTQMLNILPSGVGSSFDFTEFNGKLYFHADDGIHDNELWVTDGTPAGTQMIKDINPNDDSHPRGLTVYNGKLYFEADDDVNGYELWVTDGTATGTQMVKDINPSGDGFLTTPQFFEYNGKLYFMANDGTNGHELWVTDGSTNGTKMLKDIDPADNSYPDDFIEYNSKLYFIASDGTNGEELWVTDGTTAGTQMLMDINPSASGMRKDHNDIFLAVYNNKLYFGANDGIHGRELWETDGTVAGTQMVIDMLTAPGDGISPYYLTVVGGKLYFKVWDDVYGRTMGVTDGTAAGTHIIVPTGYPTGQHAFHPYFLELIAFNNVLYFSADYGSEGEELWKITDTTSSTGIENIPTDIPFSIYPNPGYHQLNIDCSGNINQIKIIDLSGRTILQWNSQQSVIDISNLNAGMYFIQIQTDKGVGTKSFIKK